MLTNFMCNMSGAEFLFWYFHINEPKTTYMTTKINIMHDSRPPYEADHLPSQITTPHTEEDYNQ